MSDSFGLVVLVVGGAWLAMGLALAIVMGRRGHNSFGWLVLGTLLGPLGLALALDAGRHSERLEPAPLDGGAPARVGAGPVDVLVGYDGSPESAAALDAVVALFGDRIGRLTVATVVSFGDITEEERLAGERLRQLAGRASAAVPALEILHGHPSVALTELAIARGYELIAVGTRGKGISRAVLGSAASELARDSKVPILLVGSQGPLGEGDARVA